MTKTATSYESNYLASLQKSGHAQDADQEKTVLAHFVRTQLWSLVKFITCEEDLDTTGPLAMLCFAGNRIIDDVAYRCAYWNRHKRTVYKLIRQKQNNHTKSIRKGFIGKDSSVLRSPLLAFNIVGLTHRRIPYLSLYILCRERLGA
jgi:hypothetical protein